MFTISGWCITTLRCGLFLLLACDCLAAWGADPVFDIPYLPHIHIDGDAADWGQAGFRVDAMATLEGEVKPVSDFDPHFRVGWNNDGLVLLLQVRDDHVFADTEHADSWLSDSMEVFLGTKPGAYEFMQASFCTGADPKSPHIRKTFYDYRTGLGTPTTTMDAAAADRKTADGYQMEVLLPWKNIGVTPRMGGEVALQVWAYDVDKVNDWYRTVWYPQGRPYMDTRCTYRVRLTRHASAPEEVRVSGVYQTYTRGKVTALAPAVYARRTVSVRDGKAVLGTGTFTLQENGRALATVKTTIPWSKTEMERYTVWVDGKPLAHGTLFPNPEAYRTDATMQANLCFTPSVFQGTKFPNCTFENPQLAEQLLGEYTINTIFYDRDYKVITEAAQPGRYGAVVTVTPEHGRPFTRYRTLYRTPDAVDWDKVPDGISFTIPTAFGFDAKVAEEWAGEAKYYAGRKLGDSIFRDSDLVVLLAGMSEAKPGQAQPDDWYTTSGLGADRRWWLGLKRKLYDNDKTFTAPFTCPVTMEGNAAPVVHGGTAQEAGMQPDAATKIADVCQRWAEGGGEGLGVCVVRHGVVVLHQAYGTRNGKPMTANDASGLASVTKLLNGTLLMMLVDQQRVQLDAPIATYLPAFRGVGGQTPVTLRHLYNHTSGYAGYWGEFDNDLDQITAPSAAYLQPGVKMDYTNVGYNLGAQVIEQVSGEMQSDGYRRHLLDPLGCTGTKANGGAYNTTSTPLDMAKIGQMLLNKGAYGAQRFMREETFAQMLPRRLPVAGHNAPVIWGIGLLKPPNLASLSQHTFGHTGSTSSFLFIDPDRDLVIAVARNNYGKDFDTYYTQFVNAITAGIAQ